MQKKMNKIILTIFLLMLAGKHQAQEPVSLPILIDRVLTENYQIKIVRNEALQASNNNTLGNAGFLPSVGVQGTTSGATNNTHQELFNGTIRDGEDAKSKVYSTLVEANWTIFDGFRMFAQRDKLSLLEQIGSIDARYFMEQTIADVSVAYYQLVKEMTLLHNLRKTCNVSRFRFRLEEKKKQVGSSTALAYNLAMMDYHADSLDVISQEQLIKSLQIELNRLARNNPESPLVPADHEFNPEGIAARELLTEQAIQANKNIRLAQIQELIAEKNVRIQQAARYPQIDVYGRYSYSKQTNEVGVTQLNRTYGRTFGITVRFNLYNGGTLNKAIANEKLASENSILTRQNTTELITADILDNYYEYQSLVKQQALARENIRLAEKSQEIARTQFEKGAIDGYDFRQTQLSVINAQNRLTQIGFSIKVLEIEINRLTGKLKNLL
ncbi:MAG: TolC family protein [Prolixibacteraceae bacterium]|jgi:outer membrane protein TolC|nr:TolC family protein [Prolixibacteraceae bacterium]